MTTKKLPIRPIGAKGAEPTPEQLAAERFRAFSQQMQSIAQGIIYNSLHGKPIETAAEGASLVDAALETASYYMLHAGPAVEKYFNAHLEIVAAKKAEAEKAEE